MFLTNPLLFVKKMAGMSALVSKNYCVCNPTTKQYRLIPELESSILLAQKATQEGGELDFSNIIVIRIY